MSKNGKNARSLDVIASDIHKVERAGIFDKGDLLLEAREQLSEDEGWLAWLDREFNQFSDDSARRYMNAARVAARFRTVRNLKVPARVIYMLDPDDSNLADAVEALSKAAKQQRLTASEAEKVLELVDLRHEFGDHSEATLREMQELNSSNSERPWYDDAFEALKREQPTTDDDAEAIVAKVRRAHLTEQFKAELPSWVPDAALYFLEDHVLESEREEVLERILATPQPATEDDAYEAVDKAVHYYDGDEDDGDEDDGDGEPKPKPDGETEAEPKAKPDAKPDATDDATGSDDEPTLADRELIEALNVVLHHARRPAPTAVGGVTGAELAEIGNFVTRLHEIVTGGNAVKSAADRAEARSNRNRQAAAL
jgi:hypothetical protein